MRKHTFFISLACFAMLVTSSCQRHFISDKSVRDSVHEVFEAMTALTSAFVVDFSCCAHMISTPPRF